MQPPSPNASNLNARAIVNGQMGLILLPDSWPATGEPTYRGANSHWMGTTGINNYTATQWTALENDGAVFLPHCGFRNTKTSGTTTIDRYNYISGGKTYNYMRYWLSNVSSTSANNVKCDETYDNSAGTANSSAPTYGSTNNKYEGYNVRLVHDVD